MQIEIDTPGEPSGEWWLDILIRSRRIEVSWQESRGFGLFLQSNAYGERPTELYKRAEDLARRLIVLEQSISVGAPLELTSPGQVRQLRGMTQSAIAECLHVRQPSISKLETREELMVSSLAAYCKALGARLELRVVSEDLNVPIALWSNATASKWPAHDDLLPFVSTKLAVPTVMLVVLRVMQMEVVRSFYEALGIRFEWHHHGNGALHYSSVNNGRVFEIYPAHGPSEVTHNARVGFCVSSVEATLQALRTHDSDIDGAARESEFGRVATVIDPEGTKVDLYEGSDIHGRPSDHLPA